MTPPTAPAPSGRRGVVVILFRKLVARTRRLAHRIGKCFEIIATGLQRFRIRRYAHDLPPTRSGESVGMHLA